MSDNLRARFDVELPARMRSLPRDKRGFPVPYFVEWRDGEPIFPAFDPRKWVRCVQQKRCWVCGEPLGRWMVFVIGPMCTVNRVSSEPPCHAECASYSVRVCPFMLNPAMRRVPTTQYGEVQPPGGIMEERNPGVMALWHTRSYRIIKTPGGPLIEIGEPDTVSWWTRGHEATPWEARQGFEASVAGLRRKGLELDGPEAMPVLDQLVERAKRLLPPGSYLQ